MASAPDFQEFMEAMKAQYGLQSVSLKVLLFDRTAQTLSAHALSGAPAAFLTNVIATVPIPPHLYVIVVDPVAAAGAQFVGDIADILLRRVIPKHHPILPFASDQDAITKLGAMVANSFNENTPDKINAVLDPDRLLDLTTKVADPSIARIALSRFDGVCQPAQLLDDARVDVLVSNNLTAGLQNDQKTAVEARAKIKASSEAAVKNAQKFLTQWGQVVTDFDNPPFTNKFSDYNIQLNTVKQHAANDVPDAITRLEDTLQAEFQTLVGDLSTANNYQQTCTAAIQALSDTTDNANTAWTDCTTLFKAIKSLWDEAQNNLSTVDKLLSQVPLPANAPYGIRTRLNAQFQALQDTYRAAVAAGADAYADARVFKNALPGDADRDAALSFKDKSFADAVQALYAEKDKVEQAMTGWAQAANKQPNQTALDDIFAQRTLQNKTITWQHIVDWTATVTNLPKQAPAAPGGGGSKRISDLWSRRHRHLIPFKYDLNTRKYRL
jgi:hypothetical protein